MMIPVAEPSIGSEELKYLTEAVESGWISSRGRFISEFEHKFANYCGVKHGIATCNGTTALHLALAALGIGAGDEVMVPSLTFIATANAVKYTGAEPVFVDAHPQYWCVDPERMEGAISRRTKAIIPVHLYGHPCDMEPIMYIANKYGLDIVEDAAEAHGAEYMGRKVGGFGRISCFSFYGNKIITTGEGGMCLTDDDGLAERMAVLRDHGMTPKKKYWHELIGFNFRMTNLQGAVGLAQFEKIDYFIDRKRELAGWYLLALAPAIEKGLLIPHPEMPWAKCVYWMYSVLVEGDHANERRDMLIEWLSTLGVETRPFFFPVDEMPPYFKANVNYESARRLAERGVNLPSGVALTQDQVGFVAGRIVEFLSGK